MPDPIPGRHPKRFSRRKFIAGAAAVLTAASADKSVQSFGPQDSKPTESPRPFPIEFAKSDDQTHVRDTHTARTFHQRAAQLEQHRYAQKESSAELGLSPDMQFNSFSSEGPTSVYVGWDPKTAKSHIATVDYDPTLGKSFVHDRKVLTGGWAGFNAVGISETDPRLIAVSATNFLLAPYSNLTIVSKDGGSSWADPMRFPYSSDENIQFTDDNKYLFTKSNQNSAKGQLVRRRDMDQKAFNKEYYVPLDADDYLWEMTPPQTTSVKDTYTSYGLTTKGYQKMTFGSANIITSEVHNDFPGSWRIFQVHTESGESRVWLLNNLVLNPLPPNTIQKRADITTIGTLIQVANGTNTYIQPQLDIYGVLHGPGYTESHLEIAGAAYDKGANMGFMGVSIYRNRNNDFDKFPFIEAFHPDNPSGRRALLSTIGSWPKTGSIEDVTVFSMNGRKIVRAVINSLDSPPKSTVHELDITDGFTGEWHQIMEQKRISYLPTAPQPKG